MNEWIDELADLCAAGEPVVLVTVAGVRGSAPREAGAKMLVTARETIGTIGGGQLEHECTRIAVGMLDAEEVPSVRTFPLGSAMGQCCGGVVDILFEPLANGLPRWLSDLRALHGQRMPATLVTGIGESAGKTVVTADTEFGPVPLAADLLLHARDLLERGRTAERVDDVFVETIVSSDFHVAIFGAGHVGSAVVAALSRIDCNIRWVDSRRNVFRGVPANARAVETAEPALEVAALPAGAYFLVMTHSHATDFEVCDRILRRGDAAYCGLIGSRSKRRRFEKRYRAQGMPEAVLERLVCPIGVDGITGKKPAEIAVAVAAELLQAREAAQAKRTWPDNVHALSRD
ncbi:MAG: xanthine dehydrogenase accessory protein XdhC [Woeseiaceae bacterium]|nr:xanthine dehydrogenase accessory protein XdhC [Woeseiaceae bacterium]